MMIHGRRIFCFLISCLAADVECVGSLSTSSSITCRKLSVRILTPTVFSPFLISANYSMIGPAFDLALHDIKLIYPSLNVVQEVIYDSRINTCAEWEINVENLLAASFYRVVSENVTTQSVTAVVTGGCSETSIVAKMATNLNVIFMTSAMALFIPRQQRQLYPTFLSTSISSYVPLLSAYVSMMTTFSWKSTVIIVDVGPNPYYADFGNALLKTLTLQEDFQIDLLKFNSTDRSYDYDQLLARAQKTSRVYLFSGYPYYLRPVLIAAHRLGMTSGRHVFIATGNRQGFVSKYYPRDYPWRRNDSDDEVVREAFTSVLFVGQLDVKSSAQQNVTSKNITRNYNEIWKQQSAEKYLVPYSNGSVPHPFVNTSYAALMIVAQVLDEEFAVAKSGSHFRDGVTLAKRFGNRTFVTDVGEITLGESGVRTFPVMIYRLDDRGAQFEIIFEQKSNERSLSHVNNFTWLEQWPICDRPICYQEPAYTLALPLAGSLAAALSAVVMISTTVYHRLLRLKIDERWRLNSQELVL